MGMNGPRIKNPLEDLQWETRLKVTLYKKNNCNAAIYDQKVLQLCVTRSIQHRGVFAHEIRRCTEVHLCTQHACIYERKDPRHQDPSEIPYCIWHSEHPFQTIPRELKKALSQNDVSRGSRLPSKVHIAAEAREASLARRVFNSYYLEGIKSLGAASVEEFRFNIKYLEDTIKVLYSPRSTTNRALFKRRALQSSSDGTSRRLSDLGFIFFGMDAIGFIKKIGEQESY
ncbi:hypothetical protein N7507_008689 [Penicillium longicatenatum]|nr:hypothetical protein N7507_008689 [Penicillium longicatenatum]